MKYKARPVPVQAIKLIDIALTYEKWGSTQQSQVGDWLLSKGGEVYTCDAKVFAETYRPLPLPNSAGLGLGKETTRAGWYYKAAFIDAVVATEAGTIETASGASDYIAGDYLVTNEGGDQYCIEYALFDGLYELA